MLTRGPDYEYGSLPDIFTMLRCEECGHGYLSPPPPPGQLSTIYPPTYYTVNPRSPIHLDLGCGDAERLAQIGEGLGGDVELIGVDLQPEDSGGRSVGGAIRSFGFSPCTSSPIAAI